MYEKEKTFSSECIYVIIYLYIYGVNLFMASINAVVYNKSKARLLILIKFVYVFGSGFELL